MADMAISVVAGAYTLTALSFLIISVRIILRLLTHERFKYDDYLILLSTAFYGAFTASFIVTAFHGTGLSQTPPMELGPDQVQYVVIGSQFFLVSRALYVSYLWTLKICMLIDSFLRPSLRTKELLTLKIAAVVLGLTWLLCMLIIFLECIPVNLYWQVLPSAPSCAKATVAIIITELTNIATNVLLVAIPMRRIVRPIPPPKFGNLTFLLRTEEHLEADETLYRERILSGFMYLLTLSVIAISIVRVIMELIEAREQHSLIWNQLECFFATALVNLPVLHGLCRHGCRHVRVGKFGGNQGFPEIALTVHHPTIPKDDGTSAQENCEQQCLDCGFDGETSQEDSSLQNKERSSSKLSDHLRDTISSRINSFKQFSAKVRSRVAYGGICREVEVKQETKPGVMTGKEIHPEGFDIYAGASIEPLGHVSTMISSVHECSPEPGRLWRVLRGPLLSVGRLKRSETANV